MRAKFGKFSVETNKLKNGHFEPMVYLKISRSKWYSLGYFK